jgi:hypothetical protein
MANRDKSHPTDAAEKLMLELMEKHPGASERSLLALFQNVARARPDVLRSVVRHFIRHTSNLTEISRAAWGHGEL